MTPAAHEPRNPRSPGNGARLLPRLRGSRGLWTVALALLVCATPGAAHHAADPTAPYDFRNRNASAFGSIAMPVYVDAPAGEAVDLAVPITIHPDELRAPAARYSIGFNLHNDVVRLDDVELTHKGKPVAFERDDRSSALQPRLVVPGDALPRDGPVDLVLTATATASQDGRLHVGALAIAFDAAWGTLQTDDGSKAQAYSFTLLMAQGHASSGLAPRFHGEGNSAVALVPLAAMLGLTAMGLRSAWRRVHPPPAAAKAAIAPPSRTGQRQPPRPEASAARPARASPPAFVPLEPVAASAPPASRAARAGPVTRVASRAPANGMPAFPRLLEDPLAQRRPHPTPASALPVAVVRRKPARGMQVVAGSPLRERRVVDVEAPLATAASSVVARPQRPSRASQANAREASFEVIEPLRAP